MKLFFFTLLFLLILWGCAQQDHQKMDFSNNSSAVRESVIKSLPESEMLLEGIAFERVNIGQSNFFVLNRFSKREVNSCKSCHEKPLKMEALIFPENRKSHWDILLNHASAEVMNCRTCHSSPQVWKLNSLTGKKMPINNSYNSCVQCHSQKKDDWIGGAHGKRVGGWANKRVVFNCTECHNPHSPSIEKRFPSISPYNPEK